MCFLTGRCTGCRCLNNPLSILVANRRDLLTLCISTRLTAVNLITLCFTGCCYFYFPRFEYMGSRFTFKSTSCALVPVIFYISCPASCKIMFLLGYCTAFCLLTHTTGVAFTSRSYTGCSLCCNPLTIAMSCCRNSLTLCISTHFAAVNLRS